MPLHKIRKRLTNRALRRLERMGVIDVWLGNDGVSVGLRR